ncbi:IS66 family transposase [Oligoflexus tunisiensis]|uniref:IS66 family transposase n=1 Tax=Oligoflexus tunisiensis TaxID=708132 RepID=UPI000A43AB54|nr:IS66 family transposase [Oligoflexus tunisiensis]
MNSTETIKSKYSGRSEEELLEIIAGLTIKYNRLATYLFGSRKERFIADPEGMRLLFNEPEEILETAESDLVQEIKQEQTSEPEKKLRGKRRPLPDHLPRVQKIMDLPDNEKSCSIHQVALVKIGDETVEKLEVEPAKAYVVQLITPRYKCPCCEDVKIFSAEKPLDPIPKSFATPGLLAYIATQKYVDGLPLSRQERIFERASIELDRTTMARWMIKAAELAAPLVSLLHDDLIASPVIHADETHLQVLREPNKTPESKSYMWCLARSGPEPIILYRYYDNRSKRAAADLLRDFNGYLVADAYKVYESLQNILNYNISGCFAHARRRFWEAEKFAKRADPKAERPLASDALAFIKRLYGVEERIKDKAADEKLSARQSESVPVLHRFLEWLEVQRNAVPPNSPIGKAVNYALSNWENLAAFARDGRLPIDNNFMEAHIRPFTLGRKAWLFAAVQAGANASANLYSLVESAKANRIDPFDYLNLIFKELPAAKNLAQLEMLLPHRAAHHYPLRPYNPSKK